MAKAETGDRRTQRGAVLVEFALVFPILAMLLLGLLSAALLFDANMQLTHATREGSRYGATLPQAQTFVSGNWASRVRSLVIEREGGNLTAPQVCVALVVGNPAVAVSAAHTTAGGTARCYDDSSSGETERRVQVSTTRVMSFNALVFSRQQTLTSRATTRHEING